jgi:hypothetical protein
VSKHVPSRRNTQAETVGLAVLAAFAAGRAKAIAAKRARAADLRAAVLELAAADAARGRPARGRSVRVARELRGLASVRHVRRILAQTSRKDALLSASEILTDDASTRTDMRGTHEKC